MLQGSHLFLSDAKLNATEEENLIWKPVLRTGKWLKAPTPDGKPLVVVKSGKSDTSNHIISLEELKQSFEDGAFEHVTVPMAANKQEGDHADIAKNNTGFVRKMKIVEDEDDAELVAGIEFTEPDVKDRIIRGTIPNTSSSIVYDFVRKSDAKKFPVAIDHVALTHRPVIDNLKAFGLADSDEKVETVSFEPEGSDEEVKEESRSYEEIMAKLQAHIEAELGTAYEIVQLWPDKVKVKNTLGGVEWQSPYVLNDDEVVLPPATEWKLSSIEKISAPSSEADDGGNGDEKPNEVEETPALVLDKETDDLQEAHLLREARFAEGNVNSNGGLNMSKNGNLNGLNLSDLPEDQRAAVEVILNENKELRTNSRKGDVEAKIKEWGEMGLSEAPGFLKEARRVMLSDDGSTAGILLADTENPQEEKVTATEIVERLVNALPKSEDGKLTLSMQVDSSADDTPPAKTESDKAPFDQRYKDAREALGKPVETS